MKLAHAGAAAWTLATTALALAAEPRVPVETVTARFAHGPQRPTRVPVVGGLSVGRNPFGHLPRAAGKQDYQPIEGDSFLKRNGSGVHNFIITSGAWWLRAGDRPRLAIQVRTGNGAYAQPGLLPGLGIEGHFRLAVSAGGKSTLLDQFDTIEAVLSPGSARWTCSDKALGVTVALRVRPLIEAWGFTAVADVTARQDGPVTLTWHVDKAKHVADHKDYAEHAAGTYGRVFTGFADAGAAVDKGRPTLQRTLRSGQTQSARFLCVWGYDGYDKQGVADAMARLRFRPFPDAAWLARMKMRWFDHWIGTGLELARKFLACRARFDQAVARSQAFWQAQRSRMRIRTGDARFDNVVNATSARARQQYEYPGFIHGLTYAKYGKINHGYYGFEAAGLHDEVADSLHFVADTQDPKGRQRYFMTTFAVSDWHEDMDFYFVEQCWWHWRWTGDEKFLRAIWPAARRSLEHGLATSDPDGDDLMTGYYEMWNCDQCNFGGYSALQTAMAFSALRAGADMAAALDDRGPQRQISPGGIPASYAQRYRDRMARTRRQYEARLWNRDVGAWSIAEAGGVPRPRPHTCEQNYPVWRGIGGPMQNYMALRYIRENLHRSDLQPGMTFEFINDWWPIQWSHHYVASGDTCATFHSACAAGDTDGHWPAFRSVAETAYVNSGSVWHHVGSQSMETDPLLLQAVVDGLFGIQPWLGDNRIVLYTRTTDGGHAANRFHSIVLESPSRRFGVDLTHLPPPPPAPPANILAVSCTQPYQQFPSSVTLRFDKPRRLAKLYLLTSNLVKTLKCYYPGAEMVVRYADGSERVHSMIPPYSMPSAVGTICPAAHAVKVGRLLGGGNPVCDPSMYLSVTDVLLNPAQPVESIQLRYVATETLLGVVGLTLLEGR